MSELVPAQFEISPGAATELRCNRPECGRWHEAGGVALTELVAVAREHVEDDHRGH